MVVPIDEKSTKWDGDLVTAVMRTRCYGCWGDHELKRMTVKQARELRWQLKGRTYDNTKLGDKILVSVHGTLSQIHATYID